MKSTRIDRRTFGKLAGGAGLTAVVTGPSFAQTGDVVKFGAPLPLTGPLSPEGIKQQRGYNLWADAVNAKGGIKVGGKTLKVEIVYVDYASNTPRAVQSAERLIAEDKVSFLFAPFGSGATKAASSVSEKYSIPMIAPSASSAQVYDQGYKFLFGLLSTNDSVTEPHAAAITANPAIKRLAILARNDLFPLAIAQEMEKSAKARNIEIVMFERYAIGVLDHASAITQMRAANPDWVFGTGYINDLVAMRKQMNDLGVKPLAISMIAGPAYKEFTTASGPLADNIASSSWWQPSVRYKGKDVFGSTEAFNAAFAAKYKGDEADYIEAASAACGAVVQLAMETANSADPKAVREALAKMDEETFYGKVKFGPIGQITTLQPPVFQIQSSKPIVIWPDAIKQGSLRYLSR
jgi:branched-chain amino acid transport system substrate-binding protein